MTDYDFANLSPSDFEDLSCDVLQAELGIRLESFATGRDRGIDMRYAPVDGETTIVQCKHFARSGYSKLVSHLRKEKQKVEALKPSRYIMSTSVGLTPDNKDEILDIFSPFILTTGDILGSDDLATALRRHPDVERTHFKLWLASTAVLERILNNATFTRTEQTLSELKHQVQLYVSNDSFRRAIDILTDQHVCVVAGIPGIGKTLLARMLMLHHLKQDYEAIVVSRDVSEAESTYNSGRHQFFYYDDFLGTSFDEGLPKNEESRIGSFMRQVAAAPNKRFVLTTREYILRRASARYERLA